MTVVQMNLGGIPVDVEIKDIKNLHLSVYPPTGRVRIAAPPHMSAETIRVFAISRLDWIKRQQLKVLHQDREPRREYLERESHYVWGKRYLLNIVEQDAPPAVDLKHNKLRLQCRPGQDVARRQEILEAWYREQVKAVVPLLLARWEPLMHIKTERFFVQRMKTKWGSCNPSSASIRLNTDLAKKSPRFLEYVVVHELAHLIESTHNARFIALMDSFLPRWQYIRSELMQLPVRHENWGA